MNPESRFSQRLVAAISPGAHVCRIENVVSSGMPDINVCIDGNEFWLETKIQTPGGHVLLRPFQHVWIVRRMKAQGIGFVVAETIEKKVLAFSFLGLKCVNHGDYMRITSEPIKFNSLRDFVTYMHRAMTF